MIVVIWQALTSIDIGSLICNVGAGGGAPAPVAGAAAAAAGDAPGNWPNSGLKWKEGFR